MSPAASTRKRLDQALFDNGLTESREQAKRLIMAGKVNVNGQRARKPSDAIVPEDKLEVQEPEKYVSRGGFKLEKAIEKLQWKVEQVEDQKTEVKKKIVAEPFKHSVRKDISDGESGKENNQENEDAVIDIGRNDAAAIRENEKEQSEKDEKSWTTWDEG